ncbi:MAG: TetR/AcrR family transcriptional regulator [Deltaproteobacteria bacterium]|nr:TetR/AcrR family transcriptional regulator [Deltaproteobacteria bacterium]
MQGDLKFASFKQDMNLTMEALCRELFLQNRESVRIIKEEIAVKNLVKILNAALTLCNRKGFASMSLRDLSKESGLSMGALYTYFASKDDLLRLLQSQGRTVVLRAIETQIGGAEHPRIKLRKAIQAHLYVSEIMQPWFYLSYMETKNFPREEHKKAIEAELFTEKLLIDIIRAGQEKGVFKPINSELLGAVIKAMLQDWYLKRWKYSQRRVSVDKYSAFVLDFIESYLVSEP